MEAGAWAYYDVLTQQLPEVPAINLEFENLSYSVKVPSSFSRASWHCKLAGARS